MFTKIIATLGPASIDETTIRSMREAGLNCVRINTAHGDTDQYDKALSITEEVGGLATMIDVKGPELRLQLDGPEEVTGDNTMRIYTGEDRTPLLNYDVAGSLSEGDTVYIDEGYIEATVASATSSHIDLSFTEAVTIHPDRGVNIPGLDADLPSLNERDKECLRYAEDKQIDYVAQSFVRSAADVEAARKRLSGETKIIAKIESKAGVDNLGEILRAADGVMIARGDLGVELPPQRVPVVQKKMIRRAARAGEISIVATQMLESMTTKPQPTRAEVSDVANAVLDGADAVMLSGETAVGDHPVAAVEMMRSVTREVEHDIDTKVDLNSHGSRAEEMSKAAFTVARRPSADKLVVIGAGTLQSRLVSRYRLCKQVVAVTDRRRVARQLRLVWGVKPVLVKELPETDIIPSVAKTLERTGDVGLDDEVVFYAGVGSDDHEAGNLVEAHHIGEFLRYHDSNHA